MTDNLHGFLTSKLADLDPTPEHAHAYHGFDVYHLSNIGNYLEPDSTEPVYSLQHSTAPSWEELGEVVTSMTSPPYCEGDTQAVLIIRTPAPIAPAGYFPDDRAHNELADALRELQHAYDRASEAAAQCLVIGDPSYLHDEIAVPWDSMPTFELAGLDDNPEAFPKPAESIETPNGAIDCYLDQLGESFAYILRDHQNNGIDFYATSDYRFATADLALADARAGIARTFTLPTT